MNINLLEFGKCYPGAFEAMFPAEAAAKIIRAFHEGAINKHGVNVVLETFLSQIHSVGLVGGKPIVRWRAKV